MKHNKKHWKSFGEHTQSKAFQKSTKDEFPTSLPFEVENDSDGKNFLQKTTPRRDFLKYLGFSTAAAVVAASCKVPIEKSIPFANKPEDIVPGVANWYASTYIDEAGKNVSVLVKVRDGRPIKIEGNDLSIVTKGGTSPKVQASVLSLYDDFQLRYPLKNGKESSFNEVDTDIAQQLQQLNGKPIVLLTSTINSPSTLDIINKFLLKYPGSKHVMYDPTSFSGMRLANEICYGKRDIPTYHLDEAKVIVSIGADFLNDWLSPIEHAQEYVAGRKINEKRPEMSKHIQFDCIPTLAGSNADERYLCAPSQLHLIVLSLWYAIQNQSLATELTDQNLIKAVQDAAKRLVDSRGYSVVLCGSNDTQIQVLVNAINELLNHKADWNSTYNSSKGIDGDFAQLVNDMNNGSVGALFLYNVNPVYTWYESDKVKSGMKKVNCCVSFNRKVNETDLLCQYQIPNHHYLESWGDSEVKSNCYSFVQPTINPLFKTRQMEDSLLKWMGNNTSYASYIEAFWSQKLPLTLPWWKAVQDGVWNNNVSGASTIATPPVIRHDIVNASVAYIKNLPVNNGGIEVVVYKKIGIGTGHLGANPWQQELPDPISRATWDNYLVVSPSMAKTLLNQDISNEYGADAYEVEPKKKVVTLTVNGVILRLPALIIPGIHHQTVAVALGYGLGANSPIDDNDYVTRKDEIEAAYARIGKASAAVGQNAYPLMSMRNGNLCMFASHVSLSLTNNQYTVALIQTHNYYDADFGKRTEVMKEMLLKEFIENPKEIIEDREKELAPYGGIAHYRNDGTIYKPYDYPGLKWGMSVDLNSCIGCGACVVACIAENNIPIVGKEEVARYHDMHWLRIDRYYSGNDLDNPKVVFQPMLCQQCDNAPCENVCPVGAITHSSEGFNQMTYNRCVGTRYCANNCPYKVRRFNWENYTGADSFPNNQKGFISDVTLDMNSDLVRMVLNPDVTVRCRGVMEKCSFCTQRLQEGKLKAKKEGRSLETGNKGQWDLKVACQQACPTNAIVFGNVNDKNSAISDVRKENPYRTFYSLEQLHTLPNVNYLAKVRNDEEM